MYIYAIKRLASKLCSDLTFENILHNSPDQLTILFARSAHYSNSLNSLLKFTEFATQLRSIRYSILLNSLDLVNCAKLTTDLSSEVI